MALYHARRGTRGVAQNAIEGLFVPPFAQIGGVDRLDLGLKIQATKTVAYLRQAFRVFVDGGELDVG